MMNKEVEDKISKLAALEQSYNKVSSSKYAFQNELLEFESAKSEVSSSSSAFKIIGNLMVSVSGDSLVDEVDSNISLVKERLKSLELQEKKLYDEIQKLQSEVMKDLERDKDGFGSGN